MVIKVYQNKYNPNKFLEVHEDNHSHYAVKQYMEFPNGVRNLTGDGCLHRWRIGNLKELLKDYKINA